jgi:hypothetical protein
MKTCDEPQTERGLGDNGGPPITEAPDPGRAWRLHCWRVALEAAWAPPPPEVVIRRVKRAKAVGVTYHQYTLEILERGRYL